MYGLIYMHTCTITGKSYIGQTTKSMYERLKEHISDKSKTKFHNALKKYNEKYWTHKVLAYAETKEDLDFFESFFIEKFDTIKNGYNSKTGGSHGLHSEESKRLMSINRSGIGFPHTEESKKKISKALKGRQFSEIHKKKVEEDGTMPNTFYKASFTLILKLDKGIIRKETYSSIFYNNKKGKTI